ncbi:MAG: FitA-like ribbon-helix-helix domain-containing protein [Actinomycetes bacterium]
MTTLYIRDVAEDVADRLKERAAAQGLSLSAYVAAELARLAARPTNAEIAARLRVQERSSGVTREDILAARDDARR